MRLCGGVDVSTVFFVGMQRDSARVVDGRWTGLRVSDDAWSARVNELACIPYR